MVPSITSITAFDTFTETTHTSTYPTIDPSNPRLHRAHVVCILGASKGIGEQIAYSYARAGAAGVVVASRSHDHLEPVAQKARSINPSCHVSVKVCDTTSSESVESLAEHIRASHGRVDIVVYNSGLFGPLNIDVTQGEPRDFATVTSTNYVGAYYAAHYLVPLLMDSANGSKTFLAINSVASTVVAGSMAHTAYCISKTAQAKLVEHMHEQHAQDGLLACAVHPGLVPTGFTHDTPEEFKISKLTPQGRKGTSGDRVRFLTCLTAQLDRADLCGAFLVWLTSERGRQDWLGGRLVSAKWDVDELAARREEIQKKDLLKFVCGT